MQPGAKMKETETTRKFTSPSSVQLCKMPAIPLSAIPEDTALYGMSFPILYLLTEKKLGEKTSFSPTGYLRLVFKNHIHKNQGSLSLEK